MKGLDSQEMILEITSWNGALLCLGWILSRHIVCARRRELEAGYHLTSVYSLLFAFNPSSFHFAQGFLFLRGTELLVFQQGRHISTYGRIGSTFSAVGRKGSGGYLGWLFGHISLLRDIICLSYVWSQVFVLGS